ncbi:MAG: hypothetical protein NTW95_03530 [Candidatus Aminicenantes bacterium]|nr:hypothetical protein [Candidatus Aminicenantes bacterium]
MKRRGNIVIAVLITLLLSLSGLALLTHSLLHSKIIGARRSKWQVAGGLEQALLLQLHRYRLQLDNSDMNQFSDPENDFFNQANFPDARVGGVLVKSSFSRRALAPGNGFVRVRIFNRLSAGRENSRLACFGQASVDLLKGDIPFSELPLLVNREMAAAQADYLTGKGVEWSAAVVPLPGNPLVAADCRPLLAEALQLEGKFPDWRQIREKFNLEPGAAPIPPGIYLALAAGSVKAIFVEGDLQRLEFAAANGRQSIVFRQNGSSLELSYLPGRDSVLWSGREAVTGFGFAEKIFVHGNIRAIAQTGNAAFAAGAGIQVLASGQMTVSSGLSGENLGLQTCTFANLLLMTSKQDFFTADEVNADIILAADAGSGRDIEAHLLAAGNLVHGSGSTKITGSLIAGDIQNSGILRVEARAGRFDFPDRFRLQHFQCLQNFCVQYIAEGNDE